MRRAVATMVAAMAVASMAAACGSKSGGSSAGTVKVVASFYPLAEVARQVGGSRVSVENLTPPGAEPHDLELKASQVAHVQDASLVLVLGKGFQPAVEKAASGRKQTVELLAKLPIDQSGTVQETGGPARPNALDPHVWLDPVLMAGVVDQVAVALSAADSAHAADYAANAATYKTQVTALDAAYKAGLAHCARADIVTSHEAFGRMAARYGLHQQGITGLSPDAEPEPARLAALTDFVKSHGVTTVFTETLVSPKVAQTLAREAGVKTDVLNPIEGLSNDEVAKGATYLTVMQQNLAKLRDALGCS